MSDGAMLNRSYIFGMLVNINTTKTILVQK